VSGLWIVIPAHGRPHVSSFAFAGISWAISELGRRGIHAHALVVADDENLDIADEHHLDTLRRSNAALGAKWNDGIEYACQHDAEHVLTCGSDDWVHPDLIARHVRGCADDTIMCSRHSTVVAPDGREATTLTIGYDGGDGVRLLPRPILKMLGFRPYNDKRSRALDGSMFDRLSRSRSGFRWVYNDLHPWQIVDFKSGDNVTPYDKFPGCSHEPVRVTDPLEQLAAHYPARLVDRARAFYAGAVRT
jgi:hypothetical protein